MKSLIIAVFVSACVFIPLGYVAVEIAESFQTLSTTYHTAIQNATR